LSAQVFGDRMRQLLESPDAAEEASGRGRVGNESQGWTPHG